MKYIQLPAPMAVYVNGVFNNLNRCSTLRQAMREIDTRKPRYPHNPTLDCIINKYERDQLQIEHDMLDNEIETLHKRWRDSNPKTIRSD